MQAQQRWGHLPISDYSNLILSLGPDNVDPKHPAEQHETKISDSACVGSYNWMDSPESGPSTILVPGAPAVWAPLDPSERIPPDEGEIIVDQSAARWPRYPLEPMFRALDHQRVSAHQTLHHIVGTVDVVIDRHTMAQLIDFVFIRGERFHCDVELVGGKALFVRREESNTRMVERFSGYGCTFPGENTVWERDVRGSSSHHRILKFGFGGLKYLLRVDCDAYVPREAYRPERYDGADQERNQANASSKSSEADVMKGDEMECDAAPESSSSNKENSPPSSSNLVIRSAGHIVPQSTTIDIKTRRVGRQVDMESLLPRLWLSSTPTLAAGYYNDHAWDVVLMKLDLQVKKWEEDHQVALGRLDALIRRIVETVKGTATGKCRVRRVDFGHLDIIELAADYESALPEDLYKEVCNAGD
ncbi:MAG: hypothetical protein M1828_000154 [Chrysothrix sp. TS-e1954]|nr:MAG: hypothetical protein M1828_000154 [Chrysothrix sp. TS-e1954]